MPSAPRPTPPADALSPEYPTGEVRGAVEAAERTEPWLVATADFLAGHDFSHDFADGRRYDAPTMMRAFVYQRLVGIDSFHGLASHLDGRPRVAALLGFDGGVPSGDTFREWWHRPDDRERGATETVVESYFRPALADHLLDAGFRAGESFLDVDLPDQDPTSIGTGEKREAIEHIRPLVYDLLSFGRAENATFEDSWFFDFQARISRERDFAEKNIDELHAEGERAPTPPAHFNAIQSQSAEEWMDQFEDVFDRVVEVAKGAGMLDRPVELMIDGTDLPFYGRPDAEGVVGTKKTANTTWAYKHITISARCQGRTVKLASFPLRDRGKLTTAVMYLVRRAKELVSIKRLLMDSEFLDVGLLGFLDRQDVPFIVQYRKTGKSIKRWLRSLDDQQVASKRHRIDPANRSESLDVTLLAKRAAWGDDGQDPDQTALTEFGFEKDDGKAELTGEWVLYATNIEDAGDDPKAWADRYARRWAIETNYRVIKDDFLARTTSRKFSVRVFYWLFAVMLYNAWVLLDVFLRADRPEAAPDDRPVMPARSFAKAFYQFNPG